MRNLKMQFEEDAYSISIGVRCQTEIISRLREINASSYHFVTDRTVSHLHASALYDEFSKHVHASLWMVGEGEHSKSIDAVQHVAKQMVEAGADRSSVVVAVGGGVVGNLAGLIAALLFRGIRLIHIPTTLIAAADSVASLKQAVNLHVGKNLLGCFHKPTAVLIDLNYLSTLPVAQIRSGMCEIIKNALSVAPQNVDVLARRLKADAKYTDAELMSIVEEGLLAKQEVMRFDKYERKEALVFEYGHTVGHAIELAAEGRIPHGEAIGLGMIVAAEVSSRLGRLSDADRSIHHRLLIQNGVSVKLPFGVSVVAVMALLRKDNKRGYCRASEDQIAMVLLDRIGVPAGPAERPLILVAATLVETCIEDCLVRGSCLPNK